MNSTNYPIATLRALFDIAADVKDSILNRAFRESDALDIKVQVGKYYGAIDAKYLKSDDRHLGLETIICYYAFARYSQISDQRSTSTGLKIQTYGNSLVLPDTSANKRFEAERAKADIMLGDLLTAMKEDKYLPCAVSRNQRVTLIS